MHEAKKAYIEGTDEDIRNLIQELVSNVMEGYLEPEMEEWGNLIPDPRNTRECLTLYKTTLHVYWVLKHLLAKEMEQVTEEMAKLTQGMPNMKREINNLQITMLM